MAARTYKQAQSEIQAALAALGWTMALGLKVPHATSPDGRWRLWFRPQAIHFTIAPTGHHVFADARSTDQMGTVDIRHAPAAVVAWVTRLLTAFDK